MRTDSPTHSPSNCTRRRAHRKSFSLARPSERTNYREAGRYVRKADVAVGYGLVESPWYETKAELSRLASKVTRGGLTGMDLANGRSGEISCSICSCLDFRMGVDFRR